MKTALLLSYIISGPKCISSCVSAWHVHEFKTYLVSVVSIGITLIPSNVKSQAFGLTVETGTCTDSVMVSWVYIFTF